MWSRSDTDWAPSWHTGITPSHRQCILLEGLTITVDAREWRSEVPTQLTALEVPFSTITLAVGDYAVGGRVIERKTVADLHSSLVDRRLWSQVAALRRDPRRAYVLVEGDDLDDRPVPTRAIRGALLEILDNGIRLLRTRSPEETALWLTVLARQEQHRMEHRATVTTGRRPIVTSPVGLLSAIPGISIDAAKALLSEYESIAAIAAASERDLQSIRGIGPERARALIRALTLDPPFCAGVASPYRRPARGAPRPGWARFFSFGVVPPGRAPRDHAKRWIQV